MGLNDNVKLINKSYATTREEKDKLTDSLQLAQEEISELHEKVRRGIDIQHVLEDKVTELESKLESSSQTQQKVEKDLEILESKNLELKQDLQSTKLETSSQISFLNEELEKYKTTITFLEQDREVLIADNQLEMECLQSIIY
jgi:RecB family exonuclease